MTLHAGLTQHALAGLLLQARAERRQVSCVNLPVPTSLDEAMAVQAEIARQVDPRFKGWKVAMPGPTAIAAPLQPFVDASLSATIPWGDRLGIEVELAVRLHDDIPPRPEPWTRTDILKRIDAVHLGIEPVGGRLIEGRQAPFTVFLADSLDNQGYVLGPELARDTIDRVAAGAVRIVLSGVADWDAPAAHANADPLHFLIAYANAQNDHLGGLRAGQFVTIGSLCGAVPVRQPGLLHVAFDERPSMELSVEEIG